MALLLLLLAAAVFTAFFCVYQGLPAGAVATPPPAHWVIGHSDLGRIQHAGATATFEWVMNDDGHGNVPTFTNYYAFARWARAGSSGTALVDYENSVTPRWQMGHLGRYVRLAAQLGHARRIFTILTPIAAGTAMLAADKTAARYGAGAVGIQLQWMERHPAAYAALLRSWVPQIRAAGHGTLVLTGLATGPAGRPATPWMLTRTYQLSHTVVDGYWLNVHPWPGRPGCAPTGCPQVAVEFLARIGT